MEHEESTTPLAVEINFLSELLRSNRQQHRAAKHFRLSCALVARVRRLAPPPPDTSAPRRPATPRPRWRWPRRARRARGPGAGLLRGAERVLARVPGARRRAAAPRTPRPSARRRRPRPRRRHHPPPSTTTTTSARPSAARPTSNTRTPAPRTPASRSPRSSTGRPRPCRRPRQRSRRCFRRPQKLGHRKNGGSRRCRRTSERRGVSNKHCLLRLLQARPRRTGPGPARASSRSDSGRSPASSIDRTPTAAPDCCSRRRR